MELITPPLDGTILEGVTRQSILEMVSKWVSKVSKFERNDINQTIIILILKLRKN